jgi:hypothetical protein
VVVCPSLTTRQRTPDDLAPSEHALNSPMLDLRRRGPHKYYRGGAAIAHGATTPPNYPFARTIWSGSCDAGQRSSGVLLDSSRYGQVRLCPVPCLPQWTLRRYGSIPRWRPAPLDAGRRRHIGRHGPAHCGPALGACTPTQPLYDIMPCVSRRHCSVLLLRPTFLRNADMG